MLAVLSPAKKMDMEPRDGATTTPDFWDSAVELAGVARDLTAAALSKLMHISDNLGKLNEERFANFGEQERKAAVYAFAGDTYQGLVVEDDISGYACGFGQCAAFGLERGQ